MAAYGFGGEATEDELLIAITDALTLCGWRWFHIRRSDLATVQGAQGWPDVFAIHPTRGIAMALELKSTTGQPTAEQAAWLATLNLAGIPARLVRPADLDVMLEVITGKATPAMAGIARTLAAGHWPSGLELTPRERATLEANARREARRLEAAP